MSTVSGFHSIIYKGEDCIVIKLDYTIDSPQERLKLVNQILEETPDPSEQYLEILGDYLVLCMEKQEKKERKLLTPNRLTTINKHEISYEGLTEQLENGEDGIYNLTSDNGKNQIFQPKITITKQDLEDIPLLKQLREGIERWEKLQAKVSGRDAFIVKRTLIEMRKDQYLIKNAYKKPIIFTKLTHNIKTPIPLPYSEEIIYNAQGHAAIKYSGVSFCDYRVINAILPVFPVLKNRSIGRFDADIWALCLDFEPLLQRALQNYPVYKRIIEYKWDKLQNLEIQQLLQQEFQFTHSVEYISSLWHNKIPKLIAQQAQDEYLDWYFTYKEKGQWKKCSRCGQVKLAHPRFFSINKSAKNGLYSICKQCRNKAKE